MQDMVTELNEVRLLHPKRFADDRGWFAEVFNTRDFAQQGLPTHFVQDNQSFSRKGVLRGLHYQLGKPQGKLVRVLSGEIWDVAVDLRRDSPGFGSSQFFHLRPPTATDPIEMLWIPEGFAHGFLVLSDTAEVLYRATDFYHPVGERCILWNDPTLNIPWPLHLLDRAPIVSAKDDQGSLFHDAELPPVS